MSKLLPNPIGDIQKPLERMEEALVEVRNEVERLSKGGEQDRRGLCRHV